MEFAYQLAYTHGGSNEIRITNIKIFNAKHNFLIE